MDPKIADFIRANRGRYTREAIRARLIDAGHKAEEIDWTWDRLAQTEPVVPASPSGFRWYAWGLYGLVCLGILVVIGLSMGGGLLGIVWLVAFGAIAYFPTRWFARQRPGTTLGWVGMILFVPLVFLLVGGGICIATVLVLVSTGGLY